MKLLDVGRAFRLFRPNSLTEAEKRALFSKTLLVTLARGAKSDGNLDPCEIASVQEALQTEAGETVSEADVRVAAASEMYEPVSLSAFLRRNGRKLDPSQRAVVASRLTSVLKCDSSVTEQEAAFYDEVLEALKLSRQDVSALEPTQVAA